MSSDYSSLGHLPGAPLVYTTCGIQFAPVPPSKMTLYAEDVMESLRAEYPDQNSYQINNWNINVEKREASNTETTLWRLVDPKKESGIIIGNDRLIFHTVKYSGFDDFGTKLHSVLGTLQSSAKLTHTKSVGMRYIDCLRDHSEIVLDEQVQTNLLPPKIEHAAAYQSRTEHSYITNEGNLAVRFYILKNHPGVPVDLADSATQLVGADSPPMQPIRERFIMLDTDHAYASENLEEFDASAIIEKLDALHRGASMAFRQVVSKEAIEVWRKK